MVANLFVVGGQVACDLGVSGSSVMKRRLDLSVVACSVVGVSMAIGLSRIHDQSRETAKQSAVLGLITEIERAASIFYDEHGTYPPTLVELDVTVFPDGGDARLLEEILYTTDGESFSVSWHGIRWTKRRDGSGWSKQSEVNPIEFKR